MTMLIVERVFAKTPAIAAWLLGWLASGLTADGSLLAKSPLKKLSPLPANALSPAASFWGELSYERVGYSLAGQGDVNGDGFDDLLIGTTHNRANGFDAGAVYLILGRSQLPWQFNTPLARADARFVGHTAYDAAGYSVACDGDVNGDGLADILIGAPAGNDAVKWMSGCVYVVFGRQSANWGYDFPLYYDANAICTGEQGQDLAGLSVAFIGDVNEDGCDDFVVGAPYSNQGGDDAGKVYLILGRREGWSSEMLLADAAASFVDYRAHALTGYSVAGLGDVNGDAVPDFAIGAYGASRVFIIYGRRQVSWGLDFDLDDADVMIYGAGNEGLGWKVAGPGDVNGDGVPDLVMSAIDNSQAGDQAGKVYVRLSPGRGPSPRTTSILNDEISFVGEQPYDNAGWGLSGAGDVDGDGFADFLIGAWYNDQNGKDAGKAYLIKGRPDDWQSGVPLATVPDYFVGERAINYAGYAVCSAGDFDGDGFSDYVISAPYNSEKDTWSGEIYLFASQMFPCTISGRVTSVRSDYGIAGAKLQDREEPAAIDSSDGQGNYQLRVWSKRDHIIFIEKASGEHVGACVSSYDAALIAQLALGLPPADATNARAADVSGNGRLTMYDAALTLRYAVQLPPWAYSHAGDWKFIPDSMKYDSIIADQNEQNYCGYVMGDVDMSWQPPNAAPLTRSLSAESDQWRTMRDGEELRLPVVAPEAVPVYSFDLDLHYPSQFLEVSRIEPASLIESFELAANAEMVDRLLIGAFAARAVAPVDTLLWIHFKIKASPLPPAAAIFVHRFQVNHRQLPSAKVQIPRNDNELSRATFRLYPNHPNPFNRSTTICWYASQPEPVRMAIYNALGKEVKCLHRGMVASGQTQVVWDGTDNAGNEVAAGLYLGRLITKVGQQQVKLIYLK